MKRSHFLKYASVLMMLSSIVQVIFGIMMINLFVTAYSFSADRTLLVVPPIAFGLVLLCAISEMIGGFVGVLNWEEPLRSGRNVVWGAVSLVLGLAGNIMQYLAGYEVIVAWVTGGVVPLIFLIAATIFFLSSRRKRAA